jgi:hypothetical protein
MLVIQDLIAIKRKLLDKQRQYDKQYAQYTDDEYKQGILSGITVALSAVDELLESEDDAMAREYRED